ncbi:MAG: ABC transporter ATP-binding protein [Candidatus Sumerlaeaceae bacterium]|nr:ABC transporter ATP-binding protein [Candidatus Sumerlaeaceae bacterium]
MNDAHDNGVLLKAEGLSKDYHDGTRLLRVLRDAEIEVRRGEIISIVGASGAGKSTLLHLLGALDRPSAGKITINGTDLSAMSDQQLAVFRCRSVGFIFQFHHLLAEFSALENVCVPGLILGRGFHEIHPEAEALLRSVGLEERLTHRPSKMSGGEQQRVALARAMVNNPDLILADEPTGNLDTETAEVVIKLLWGHTREKNKSLVIVTHEPDIAKRADRCLRLRDGRLIPE